MTESFHPDIRGTRASGATRFRIVYPYIFLLGQKLRKPTRMIKTVLTIDYSL